ncbi:MAG: DmsE family decaheme c-type cytochrome [Acidobacteria bacterium]|nr:DmsE family decaheme c-type cytochrome [Acidobacteriota bacterium]
MTPSRLWKLTLVCCSATLLAGVLAARPKGAGGGGLPQRPGSINNEDCAVCHEDLVKAFERNAHALLEKSPRFNLANSCESCHGPGQAHAEGGGDIALIVSFKEDDLWPAYNRQCLTCHEDNHALAGFGDSRHGKAALSCASCHGVHRSALTTRALKQPTNELCFGCHVQSRADFARPYHHRVPENAMRCTDCHQPHGGLDRPMLAATFGGEEPCLKCHAEKEGPFVFEHAGVSIKDCRACHQPHGSNNPRMLVRSTVRSLCLECHTMSSAVLSSQPPAFHDLRSPRYQNCTTCHTAIHGSNASSLFLR